MNQEPLHQINLSHYPLVSKIGAGGMGEVYRARDTRLDREVAIKMLPADFANDADRLRRFEPMLQWYESVFGAKVQYQNPGLAFLTYDDEHHRFAFANMSLFQPEGTDTERQGAIGVDHVAYTYASLQDLLDTYARLKEQGVTPYWCIHHGISVSLYYAEAFMQTHWDANPLGVEFDPDDWLARLNAGTPESDFLRRQAHEPVSPLRGEFTKFLPTN